MTPADVAHWDQMYASQRWGLPWEEDTLAADLERWWQTLRHGDRVLDLGCGRGAHVLEFARRGHAAHGIDASPVAIAAARVGAERLRLPSATFQVADITTFRTSKAFDFVYDYSVFHHMPPGERGAYAATAAACVRHGGRFGLVSYSDRDPDAGGRPSRVTPLGNTIYHPTKQQIMELLESDFELLEAGESVLGRRSNHVGQHLLLRRRAARG
jgi:cyclopropane fatty-acyl-phospholipid synthase-like methyltransferase